MTPALDVPACAKGERPWTFDICPMWVSWTDEDVGFFEGGCDIRPNLDGSVVAHECCMHMFSTTLLVEQGWSQLISLCPSVIAHLG